MTLTQRLFAITVSTLFLILIIGLIRQRKLSIEYSLLWIVIAATILVLSIWKEVLTYINRLTGAVSQLTTLFICGILFLVVINVHFSLRFTKMSERIRLLAQENALHRYEIQRLLNGEGPPREG